MNPFRRKEKIIMARFVKIGEDGNIIDAPAAIRTEDEFITNPSETDYNANGYYVLDDTQPECGEGYRISWGAYKVEDNKVVRAYTLKPEVDNWVEPDYEYRIISDEWVEKDECFERVVVTKKIVNEGKDAELQDGYHWEIGSEEEGEESITIHWVQVQDAPEPEPYVPTTGETTYSKLKLEIALFNMGKLSKFEEFLMSKTIENEQGEKRTLKQFYDVANDLTTGNTYYEQYKEEAFTCLGMTEDEANALLANCIQE